MTRAIFPVFFALSAFVAASPALQKPAVPNPWKYGGMWKGLKDANRAGPLSVVTEKSTDCNEFPDPGYGGTDPDTYQFWPEAAKIKVGCYLENSINGLNYTYLRTTSGCYVDEMSIQANGKDFTSLLPKCQVMTPYQVFTTKNEYLLPKDGFWMSCYKAPKKNSKTFEVQWGARHTLCALEGEAMNGDDIWYRDAHSLKGDENNHCYIPADAFDNMVYEVPGARGHCSDLDQR